MFLTPSSRLRKGTDREKPSVRMVWGACDSGEVPERERPPDFNEQVTVNSEQVSVGRGVPPNRQRERNKNMNDTTKSKAPRATDERFVARGRRAVGCGRRAYWDNGRPARCMGRTWTVHGTGGTPVVPVGGSAGRLAPPSPPSRRRSRRSATLPCRGGARRLAEPLAEVRKGIRSGTVEVGGVRGRDAKHLGV